MIAIALAAALASVGGTQLSDAQLLEIFRSVRSTEILDRLPPGPDVYTGPRADIESALSTLTPDPAAIRRVLAEHRIPDGDLLAIAANPEPAADTGAWHLRRGGDLYEALKARAMDLESAHPGLVRLEYLPASSVSATEPDRAHRPVFVLHLTSPVRIAKKVVYLQGGIHGDEVAVPEYMLRFVEWAAGRYGQDPAASRLLDQVRFVIVPAMNPDGLAMQTRVNAHGVDLNRNMDADHFGGPGSSGELGRWNYRGPSARSEPESKAIEALVKRERPALFLDFHQYSEQVLFPWAWTLDDAADPALLALVGELAGAVAYEPIQTSDYGLASGDITDWAYGELSRELGYWLPAYCVEIGDDMVTPYRERDSRFKRDILPMLLRLAELDLPGAR